MSSPGHWEVVSKSKKPKQNGQTSTKLSKTEKKKFTENAPKVEDILPLAQVKSLYSDADIVEEIQENKKPEKDVKPKEEPKKVQKKQNEKKKEAKDKGTKNSQELDEGEFLAVISEGQSRYSDVPLVWLRDLTAFINSKLAPVHSVPPSQTSQVLSSEWPSKLLPTKVRKAIEVALLEETAATQLAFFNTCLIAIANDMSKGLSALGHKIMLQILIHIQPGLASENVAKSVAIRNSYQNRPPICLTILGAIGQAGHKDINIGLTVWLEVMFPLVENRNYSRWVISYLASLISAHTGTKKLANKDSQLQSSILDPELYFQVLDRMLPVGNSLTSQVQKELVPHLEPLRNLALQRDDEQLSLSCFPLYLKRLQYTSPKILQNEVLEGLVQCLSNFPECFSIWYELYPKHLIHSALLLQHVHFSLENLSLSKKAFLETLKQFQTINMDLLSKKKDKTKMSGGFGSLEGLEECSRVCDELLEKVEQVSVKRGFPYIKGSFLCLLGIIGLIVFDVNKHGGVFKDSSVGHLLSDIGALPTVEYSLMKIKYYYIQASQWTEANLPVYTVVALETVKPYVLNCIEFISYWTSTSYHYLVESYPVIMTWVDDKAPGLREKILDFLAVAWNGFKDFSIVAFEQSLHYSMLAIEWIRENIFVGHFSPENIQKISCKAYNATQMYAVLTIDWILGKVQ